jgi:hypothetical protein
LCYVDRPFKRLTMPRYFFHCRSGCEAIPDDTGVELPDNDAARFSALQIIDSMLKDGRSDWRGWVMVVGDLHGKLVAKLPFVAAPER